MFTLTCQCDSAGWVAAAQRVVMDTLRVWLGLIRGLTLLSRHHSPSLSIVDELNWILSVMWLDQSRTPMSCVFQYSTFPCVVHIASGFLTRVKGLGSTQQRNA